jgi:hypothetical protein
MITSLCCQRSPGYDRSYHRPINNKNYGGVIRYNLCHFKAFYHIRPSASAHLCEYGSLEPDARGEERADTQAAGQAQPHIRKKNASAASLDGLIELLKK